MPNGLDEHLEVFLVDSEQPEKAYNVYDPLLQRMLVASFAQIGASKQFASLDVEFDGIADEYSRRAFVEDMPHSASFLKLTGQHPGGKAIDAEA